MNARKTLRIAMALLLVAAVVAALAVLPVKDYLAGFLEWIESVGAWGPVLLAAAYTVACVLFVPGSILTLGAGFLFGVVWGTIAVSIGSVLGATAAFLVGRTFARGWIEGRIASHPRFQAIDRAVGEQGFKIVLLVRLSPIFPFNLLNYAFGLTKVRLWQYVLASWIGMLPGTVMYVYLGSALKSLADVAAGSPEGGTPQTVFFVVGLAMTIVATVVVTRVAKRALDEAVAEHGAPSRVAGTLRVPSAGAHSVCRPQGEYSCGAEGVSAPAVQSVQHAGERHTACACYFPDNEMRSLLEEPMTGAVEVLPDDIHNRKLIDNVHPGDWANPEPAGRYNLVVIGAGTAGLVAAAGAAGLGAKVALVERHLMGGDCLNYGCVPSKGIISAARACASVRDAGRFGVNVPDGWTVDFGAVMERMRQLRAGISGHDSAARFRDLGIDVFLGEGQFAGPDTVEVAGRTLRFTGAVIATGARAAAPPIPGLDEVEYLTNETIFSLTELPSRIGIIGAGPIGCELAQTFARLGSEVFLVEAAHGILPREDPEAAKIVKNSLLRDGVRLLCCGDETEVHRDGAQIRLYLESHGKSYDEPVDKLLVAVGRAPNVGSLNLEAAGVEYDSKAGVEVDDKLRTSNSRIFAAGDVCSRYKFTHAADFMARIVIRNALFKGRAKASALTIPWCTYTSPEIAHVGLYPSEAEKQGIAIDTHTQELSHVDRAILEGATEGFVRVHVKKGTDQILGATIVAANAGDMISEITLAMTHGLGLKKIAEVIHPYPTQAEAIRTVGDVYNRSRLTPFVKSLFQKWLAWTR